MIPNAYIQAWSATAPWPDPRQVEQDLIICRALCDLFNAPALKGKIAFRGGTAINKLLFAQPLRYSEDIDLVQTQAEPIGTTVDAIRDTLSWLGKCNREQAGHSMHLVFKFTPEADAQAMLKLKVEINTRERADNPRTISPHVPGLASSHAADVATVADAARRDGTRPTTLGRDEYGYSMQNIARAYPLPAAETDSWQR